ncbi:MAG: hypothetical protein M3P38_03075 [Chloroflexota bacterium]|nr:hypothetical protein [Chloroflexota bacterium]
MLVWPSLLAFVVGLGRTFIDWGIVYPELGLMSDAASAFPTLVAYSLVFGVWAWALIAMARGQRRGVWVALVLTLLANVGLGLGTTFAFCPTPCQTLWPIGELWNWATTLTGAGAVIAQVSALRSAH